MNNVIRNESVQTMAKQLKTDTITSSPLMTKCRPRHEANK